MALPPEVADNVRMEEMVSEQFESYKRTASKTLNAVNAPLSSTEQTCSVSNPDEWWSRNRTRFPLVFAVWQHVSSLVLSSGQIERDFGAASDALPRKRAKTDHRYFQAQLIGNVNYPWMSEAHEMFAEDIHVSHCRLDKLDRSWVWGP
jgi:hypothetical protein